MFVLHDIRFGKINLLRRIARCYLLCCKRTGNVRAYIHGKRWPAIQLGVRYLPG